MVKRGLLMVLGIVFIIVIIILSTTNLREENVQKEEISSGIVVQNSNKVNYQEYNHQFVDEGNVEQILDKLIGDNGKVEFYLPPTSSIDVKRGEKFGVAFAINNPNPSGNNYFEYEFMVDSSTLTSCEVNYETAQGWISMGQKSFGKIPQGWIDKMTIYFIFEDVPKSCIAKYNFEVKKDGATYSTKQLVFNLI
jgi:hypothetical protein